MSDKNSPFPYRSHSLAFFQSVVDQLITESVKRANAERDFAKERAEANELRKELLKAQTLLADYAGLLTEKGETFCVEYLDQMIEKHNVAFPKYKGPLVGSTRDAN